MMLEFISRTSEKKSELWDLRSQFQEKWTFNKYLFIFYSVAKTSFHNSESNKEK